MTQAALSTASSRAWTGELRATLQLSWPLVLTNLAQIGMTTTDVVMLGHLGPGAVAAGALGVNLYFAVLIFGIGLMSAAAPLIAVELGRHRFSVREVRRTVRQGCWTALCISLPMWLFLWNGEAILRALGQNPALAQAAGAYLRVLQWSTLPFFLYLVLRSFLAALERPGWAFAVVAAALVFNAVANWALIFGRLGLPRLELVGSGIATLSASVVMFVGLAVVVSLDRRFRRYRVFGRFWRADWPRFREFWRIGLPIGAALAFEVTIFNAAVFLMGLIGAAALAAHAIAIQIASLTFMVPMGIGQAATVRVGRAAGAGDPDGIRRAGWTAFALGVGFMALTGILMITMPKILVAGFFDTRDPANAPVLDLAVTFLAFAALFQIADGAQTVCAGMLRGLHDTRVPMIYAAIGYWGIGLPLGAALGFGTKMQGAGIWAGLAAGLIVVAALLIRRWIRRERLGLVPAPVSAKPLSPDRRQAQDTWQMQ